MSRIPQLSLLLTACAAMAAPLTIDGPLQATVDPDHRYALTSLRHRDRGLELLAPAAQRADQDLWRLHLRLPDGGTVELRPADAKSATHELAGDTLTLTWRGVGAAGLTVVGTITRRADGTLAWRLRVQGTAPGALWQVDWPRLGGLRSLPDDELALPLYLGRLVRRPGHTPWSFRSTWPQPLSMQFWAWWGAGDDVRPALPERPGVHSESGWLPDGGRAAGLYWATEDGAGWLKRFAASFGNPQDTLSVWVEHVPPVAQWPLPAGPQTIDYATPYDTVLAPLSGDWHEACARYQSWAKTQPWCARGPADTWPQQQPAAGSDELVRWVPPWFREVGFWAKFYHEPAKVVPEWAAYRKWLKVPLASHYYRYNIAKFDDNYPEHLPGDPYLLQGLRAGRDMDVRALPYVQGSIWDTDTPSWHREHADEAALRDEHGGFSIWDIAGEMHAWMCPTAPLWQGEQRRMTAALADEHDTAGNYLDVLVATGARECFNPQHGHPLHGGTYWGQGSRKLLWDLRAQTRRFMPDASFFSEECGEFYIDLLDGQLTLDQLRFGGSRPNVQVFPLFSAVYHPYTINFGCDAGLGQPVDFYCWEMGQMQSWGAVPLNSPNVALPPSAGDAAAEFLRDLVQAYYVAGRPFLQGGQMLRVVQRPTGTPATPAAVEVTSAPHEVTYTPSGLKTPRTWFGPAVLASAWRRGGDVAVVLVNISGAAQPVGLRLRPEALGLAGARLYRTWPDAGGLGLAGGAHPLTVPARRTMVLVVTQGRPPAGAKLLEAPWELLSVTDGPFAPVNGAAGSLWACADGPVRCQVSAQQTVATALSLRPDGTLIPREGRQAKRRAAAAEGHGLPRAADEQPFLLLRRLPLTMAGDGEVVVWSAADEHFLGLLPAEAKLTAPRDGVWALRPSNGSVAWSAGRSLTVPAGGALVAWAAGGPVREPSVATLAAALADWSAAVQAQRERPGAFLPQRPLMRQGAALQALAAVCAGWSLRLQAADDWLSPATPKPLRLVALRGPGAVLPSAVALQPLGPWPSTVTAPTLPTDWAQFPLPAACRVGDVTQRVVPVLARATVRVDGQELTLSDVLPLEANRPVELRLPTVTQTVFAGRTLSAPVTLRNWSPQSGRVTLQADGPAGWQVTPEPAEVPAEALQDGTAKLLVRPPLGAAKGLTEVRVSARWNGAAEAEVLGTMPVSVMPALAPVQEGDVRWTAPAADNLATNRREGAYILGAAAGERLRLVIKNIRVTIYNDTLSYNLRDPDLRPLRTGRVPADQSATIDVAAPATGFYTLEVAPGSGSAQVLIDNRVAAEVAEPGRPLRLFCSRIHRWFWVPPGARTFRLGYTDGGPDETAHLVVRAPSGRVALDYDGNGSGSERPIAVRPDEAGALWTLEVVPKQDMSVWLAGDVTPCLSTSPERTVREVAAP